MIGARSGHLTTRDEQGKGTALADLYVDLGVDDAAGVAALGVRIGDPVVLHPPSREDLAFLHDAPTPTGS